MCPCQTHEIPLRRPPPTPAHRRCVMTGLSIYNRPTSKQLWTRAPVRATAEFWLAAASLTCGAHAHASSRMCVQFKHA